MTDNSTYEARRKNLKYYKKCLEIIDRVRVSTNLNSIIDIGGWAGSFVSRTNMNEKVCLDRGQKEPSAAGVKLITEDFLTWTPDKKYDMCTCLQVLEHIQDEHVSGFAEKLFTCSPRVLISVPYMWSHGSCKYHYQDPVDEKKLFKWTKRHPVESILVEDNNRRRLINLYK